MSIQVPMPLSIPPRSWTICDLIITSDTALAHLAGGLGRPTWLALNTWPDWRWFVDRADSPWYKGMRLFRQSSPGELGGGFRADRVATGRTIGSTRSTWQRRRWRLMPIASWRPPYAKKVSVQSKHRVALANKDA